MTNTHDNLGYWCSEAVARCPERVAMIDLCGGDVRKPALRVDSLATR
jgi:hypothetical protein